MHLQVYRLVQNSHCLSAEECIMAAELQSQHPNPCKLSGEGHFGSKFATVVVTGQNFGNFIRQQRIIVGDFFCNNNFA